MFRFVAIIIVFWLINIESGAQSYYVINDTTLSYLDDTLQIKEVEIVSPVSGKYQVGSKTQKISSTQMDQMSSSNLTTLLSSYSSIYIKSNAGGLSSFSFRGTSADHTAVMFGGLTINSLTLGSSNPNNVPVYLFDRVDVLFGSSSASVGSGAIGGGIKLSPEHKWTDGQKIQILSSLGSFGMYTNGTKIFLGNGKFESVTRVSLLKKENNFEFTHTETKDFETGKFLRETQRNAAIDNKNIIQELNYKFSEKQNITSTFWYAQNWHEIQPTVEANASDTVETYRDNNFRAWIQYNNKLNHLDFYVGAGYVYDRAVQNNNTDSLISTQRLVSELGFKSQWKNIKYDIGLKYKHIVPDVYAYKTNPIEDRLDIYSSFLLNITSTTNATVNLRKQFVTDFNTPFTPALGIEHRLLSNENAIVKLSGNIQKSHRTPTLNDRYWDQPRYKANINLKPEEGINLEGGINYTYCSDNLIFRSSAQVFYMDVDNWLMWIPKPEGWIAANVLRVISKGIELHSDTQFKIGKSTINLSANYTYNSAVREESENNTDIIGRQLEYTPKHLANGYINLNYKSYGINCNASFTGQRYYNQEIGRNLPSYKLIDICAYKNISINKHNLKAQLNVNNLFSEQYQNEYRYAMPKINYSFSIKYTIKNT